MIYKMKLQLRTQTLLNPRRLLLLSLCLAPSFALITLGCTCVISEARPSGPSGRLVSMGRMQQHNKWSHVEV